MNWIFSCQSEGRQNNNGKDCGFKITKVDDIMAGNTNLIFRLENKHRSVWKYWLRSIIIFGLFLAILIFLSHLTLIFVVKVFQKFFFSSFLNFFKNFFSVELTFPIAPFIIWRSFSVKWFETIDSPREPAFRISFCRFSHAEWSTIWSRSTLSRILAVFFSIKDVYNI